jgi:beta-glucosidase
MKQTTGTPLEGFAEFSRKTAAEGIVLLKNNQNTLPIKESETLSLFGRCQIDYYRSGTGSGGAVNVAYSVNALQGIRENSALKLNEELAGIYEAWVKEHPFDNGGGGWAAEPWFQEEMPLTGEQVDRAVKISDKAVVIIGRTAGEDQDNADKPGSYRLTQAEQEMIAKVSARFQHIILVMNVTSIMDMSWLETMENKDNIKAVLYSWAGGVEGGHALADILSGKVTPSGHLSDTIAYDLTDYPASENFGSKIKNCYQEDIYVGYRYFETFKPEAVQFAFGEGLSYTTFSRDVINVSQKGSGTEEILEFQVKVKNTGKVYAGKEVVQVYCEAPQGKLGKPARVLAAFAKSGLLKPGEESILTLTIPVKSLASYDDGGVTGHKSCYLLEEGLYRFFAGGSVKEAELIQTDGWGGWMLERLLVTEKLSECLAPVEDFTRMKPGHRNKNGSYEIEYEPVPRQTVSMKERIESRLPEALELSGDRGIKLKDVKAGKATLEEFVAQMTREDLAAIVRAEGMCSPRVTPGTASAFGGLTPELFNLGIPVACASDGPSGIRMDSGHKATQVPIGTLLACTWNTEMIEELYHQEGQEMQSYRIDTLLGPGINIHRHPLNGRNFEYFSEDPFLTGKFAAAQTRGLKKAGVSGTIKHYAANDQETARHEADSILSERALREIHVKAFEMAVKEGEASTIMTAYNPINGHWTASNYDLNTTLLRGEWGFTGIVMTDWWAKIMIPLRAVKKPKPSLLTWSGHRMISIWS